MLKNKEAVIEQIYNDKKRMYEYFVKGLDVTESIKVLLARHKEAYDQEKRIFAGIDGYLEAQKHYEKRIAELEEQLKNAIVPNKQLVNAVCEWIQAEFEDKAKYSTCFDESGYEINLTEELFLEILEKAKEKIWEGFE